MSSKELYAIYRTKEFKFMANFRIYELLFKISDDEFVEFFEKFKKEIGTKSEYKLDDKVMVSKSMGLLKNPSYYANQSRYLYRFTIRGARKVVRTEKSLIRRLVTVDIDIVHYNYKKVDNPKIFKNIDETKLLNKYLESLRGDEIIGLNRREIINLVILKYYNYQND